jgi:energy-converting hydrogenase Eha subunit A
VCVDVACIYILIGSGWTLLNRAGLRPLGFEPVIVLLTGIHFHYAGFALPLLTGLALREVRGRSARWAALGVIFAVPLVAVGITATQLKYSQIVESAAAWLMAAAGTLSGWIYLQLAHNRSRPRLARMLWGIAALSLMASMVFAAVYGTRFFLPMQWLDIPWMRALHGTANALGFGLAGIVGWTVAGSGRASESIQR